MKSAVIALLLAAAGQQATAVTTSSRAFATQWLRSHAAPQADELAELRGVNPEAYAIVKALLTKRSLGLLDPKHPTASFAAPPPKAAEDEVPQGPEVYQQFQSAPKDAVYADVPAPTAHHDWLSWKPQNSAMDDDAMVKSVLGAVASLKAGQQGGNLRGAQQQQQQQNDGLTWTQPAPAAEIKAAPIAEAQPAIIPEAIQPVQVQPVQVQPVQAAPKASMSQENSYLKDVDFGIKTEAAPAAPALGDNSYLKGLNLDSNAAPVAAVVAPHQQEDAAPSALSSFSFDDSAPATTAAPKATVAPKAQPGNALLAWLGGSVQKKAAPKVSQIQTPKKDAMSAYLADLQ